MPVGQKHAVVMSQKAGLLFMPEPGSFLLLPLTDWMRSSHIICYTQSSGLTDIQTEHNSFTAPSLTGGLTEGGALQIDQLTTTSRSYCVQAGPNSNMTYGQLNRKNCACKDRDT